MYTNQHVKVMYKPTCGDFQCFVRETLIEIHKGQEEMYKRINNMESNINDSIQLECRRISELENQVEVLEDRIQQIGDMNQQLMSHKEQLNKL